MTPREVSPGHFPNLAVTLFADRTVIAFTPATSDLSWAANATWGAARAVARTGRRVGLVDLSLERPALQPRTQGTTDEGIVDAFVFGVSLGHVAREQEANLHFIPVGSTPADPKAVWASDRWRRLARGFQQEGALLLLFLPPAALSHLVADLDGLVVLSPVGYSPESPTFPGIGECVQRGTPLIAIVCDQRPVPASAPRTTPGPLPRPSRSPWQPARRRRGGPLVLGALGALGIGAVVALLRAGGSGESPPEAVAAESVGQPSAPRAVTAPEPPPKMSPGDSLFYCVQVAAFNQPDQAAAFALTLADLPGGATVSPVRLGRQGLWYRVTVGMLPSASLADSLLRALWRIGAVERPSGTVLRTPHAYQVGAAESVEAAREMAEGVRQRGVAAYIVAAPDGSARVLTGSFETPDQGLAADSLLRSAGLRATLVQRMGIRR